jgi:hypothetical protein
MKKFYFSRRSHLIVVFLIALLFGGFSLFAQQIFTEHNSGALTTNINYEHQFDNQYYTKVSVENGDKIFLKNQAYTQQTILGENATNGALSISLVFDENQYYVSAVLIFNEAGYMQVVNWSGTKNFVVNVPDGTYDIMTEFQAFQSGNAHTHIVIKEQQSIQGNTSLQLNTADAVNYVSITTYDENGNILEPEAGVGGAINFNRFLNFNPIDLVPTYDYYSEVDPFGGADAAWNFYINDVSSRYSIIQTLIGKGYSQGLYFNKYETITGIDEPVSLENDPADWSYHEETFQPTPLGVDGITPAYFAASTLNGNLLIGWAESAGGIINPGDADFRAFINNPINGDPADFWVIPAIVDKYVIYDPTTGGESYYTKGNPVFSDGNGGVLYGSGDVSSNTHSAPFMGDDYYLLANKKIELLPLNPRFSFDNTTTDFVAQGNNVPIIVTSFKATPNTFHSTYRGRYGESRESDYLVTQIEVKQNGNVIFSGSYEDFKTFNLPSSGQFEIVLTNNNVVVDGLTGKNATTIVYNADEDDIPPSLQHLQFRNSEDQVTSVFDSGEGATVRLAAGDFNFTASGGGNGYYTYEAGNSVSLSYSLYNQNDWTNLELTEYPEYFQMPAFGDYYEASLEGIGNETGNAWYDVKVICTDAAGNKQEQIISPAFKINEVLGVQDINISNFTVYPNPFSEQLNVVLPKDIAGDYSFKVTDLTGRTIYTNNQSGNSFAWNTSFLSPGVYILSIENNGMAISKKVIKL